MRRLNITVNLNIYKNTELCHAGLKAAFPMGFLFNKTILMKGSLKSLKDSSCLWESNKNHTKFRARYQRLALCHKVDHHCGLSDGVRSRTDIPFT